MGTYRDLEKVLTTLVLVCTRSSTNISWLLFWCFYGIPACTNEWFSVATSSFVFFFCLAQLWHVRFCFILLCIVLYFFIVLYSLEACLFPSKRKRWSEWEVRWEGLGGVEGGETMTNIHYLRENFVFNRTKNGKKWNKTKIKKV